MDILLASGGIHHSVHATGAAIRVHCDFTATSARRRLVLEMETRGIGRVCRLAIVNLWRTTRMPSLDASLAVCDPAHTWTYFHGMQFDEVLLFKQYDSATDMPCHTPHAAFTHPATPTDTPPRERIEIRCLLIFD
jgi:hypothetical protein